jgi:hypothetical protein
LRGAAKTVGNFILPHPYSSHSDRVLEEEEYEKEK